MAGQQPGLTPGGGRERRPLEILPSIDIRGGRVVDLFQGDFARETVYDDSPSVVAQRFIAAGARWLHLVDLDGAKAGAPANRAMVEGIATAAAAAGVRLQLGGGIRTLDAARRALDAGATRVIFGTAAVDQPEVVAAAVAAFGADAVVVGIDARDGTVATHGWARASELRVVDLARRMAQLGVARLLYTDIARDSTLTGPNLEALQALNQAVPVAVIAAGGITTVEQIRRLARIGVEGAVIGSALYAGTLTLQDALAAARVASGGATGC
jgi:phosphoribosylformimino-5-aminoimidazole carboxamide ribotide isomerase